MKTCDFLGYSVHILCVRYIVHTYTMYCFAHIPIPQDYGWRLTTDDRFDIALYIRTAMKGHIDKMQVKNGLRLNALKDPDEINEPGD